jgi:hypothetical protein
MSVQDFKKLTVQFKDVETNLINKYKEVAQWDQSPGFIKRRYYQYLSDKIGKEFDAIKVIFHKLMSYDDALKVLYTEQEHKFIMSTYQQAIEALTLLHRQSFGVSNQSLTCFENPKDDNEETEVKSPEIDLR